MRRHAIPSFAVVVCGLLVVARAGADDFQARYPTFQVAPRIPVLEEHGEFPCSQCHDDSLPPDPTPRVLKDAHEDIALVHGGGRFWCATCHGADRDKLVSLQGEPISFDEQFLQCGACHFERQRDFFAGAHGKRLESWRGDKKVLACTSCHDAHDPSIKARKPWRREPHVAR